MNLNKIIICSLIMGIGLNMGCQLSQKNPETLRQPASTQDLVDGADRVLKDLHNESIFNAKTCATYVDGMTTYLYNLPSNFFVPKTPQEIEYFKQHGVEVLKTLFAVRVALHERFQEFDQKNELEAACTTKIREGIQYSRITEEYVLEWLVHNNVVPAQKDTTVLASEEPYMMTNPKYAGFQLKTGDLMIIRGKSYVSAMIARIADEEGNFSHLAIVSENEKGEQFVVEAEIQLGVVITPLAKWRTQPDARIALYRQHDAALGHRAGQKIYQYAKGAIDKGAAIRYDFAMNDDDYTTIFCSEVGKYAYDKGSDGKFIIPKFRSTISKFKNSAYPKNMGVTAKTLFAPYDMEVDPRFDFVAEYKYYPLLRQVRMQDAVLQSVYNWIIQKNYSFHWTIGLTTKAYFAKFIRQFGFIPDLIPKYMPMNTIKTTLQFQEAATALENNIYAKEDAYYKAHGYLPTFSELTNFNEEYRIEDCKLQKKAQAAIIEGQVTKQASKFHWFFYADNQKCE